jgi:hypothetical protein
MTPEFGIAPEPGPTCVLPQGTGGPVCGKPAVVVWPIVNPGTGDEGGIALCAEHRDLVMSIHGFGGTTPSLGRLSVAVR